MKYIISIILLVSSSYCQRHNLDGSNFYYKLSNDNNTVIELDKNLSEISGLASDGKDRIFAHNDEEGIVYIFDTDENKIIRKIQLGKKVIKNDFEGIAIVRDSVYLITSSGVLYKFSASGNQDNADYTKIKTGLSHKYNIEGLCFDPSSNILLIACKGYPGKHLRGYKAVYEFDLTNNQLNNKPKILIDLKLLKSEFGINDFSPSGIEIHPVSGNYFIISSHAKAMIEISRDGNLVSAFKLKNKYHKQPEGIAFLSDNTLVISDEGRTKKAKLSFIPFDKH